MADDDEVASNPQEQNMSAPEKNVVRIARKRFAIFLGVTAVALAVGLAYCTNISVGARLLLLPPPRDRE